MKGKGYFLLSSRLRSIIELARSRGYTVEEAPVSVHEAMEVGGWVVTLYILLAVGLHDI